MNFNNCFLILFLFAGYASLSQERYTKHIVSTGETVSSIARQYNVKINAIYKLNPEAKKRINIQSELLIPVPDKIEPKLIVNRTNKMHIVLPKDRLYGIAKQYGIGLIDLYKINPGIKNKDLKVGQEIILSETEVTKVTTAIIQDTLKNKLPEKLVGLNLKNEATNLDLKPTENEIVYEVQAKDSKYGISKKNGITVLELEKANPILEKAGLKIGQKIIIPVKSKSNSNLSTVNLVAKDSVKLKDKVLESIKIVNSEEIKVDTIVIIRKVLPKETKYGIAKEYGIPIKELERQNPQIVEKFHVGSELSIRTIKINDPTVVEKQITVVEKAPKSVDTAVPSLLYNADFKEKLVASASGFIGVRYRSGGSSSDGFDCSGLVHTTFENFNINLPRTSFEQSQYGIVINNDQAEKGDLIFFRTNGSRSINHVGMIVEVNKDDIKFIHASSSGVMISSLSERYYSKRFSQINRVLQ